MPKQKNTNALARPKDSAEQAKQTDPLEFTLGHFTLTSNGLVINGEPSIDEWRDCGAFLRRVEKSVGFWLGDWLQYGETRWGQSYAVDLAAEYGLAYNTLRTYKYVAARVPIENRNAAVPFSAYLPIAPLPIAEQKKYIALAARDDLDADAVKLVIKKNKLDAHHDALPKFKNGQDPFARAKIFNIDSRAWAAHVPPLDLIFTSPVYNVGIKYKTYVDELPHQDWLDLLYDIFCQCYDSLVTGGRIGVNVPYGVGRSPYKPIAPDVMGLLETAGFTLRGQITWDKMTTGNRTTWGSWLDPSNPALRDRTECIIIAHKIAPDMNVKGPTLITDPAEFMTAAQDVWQIPPESAERVHHPAPFPIALAERYIKFFGFAGAHVGDPFAGAGNCLIAALRCGCYAYGADIDPTYCAEMTARVKEEITHASRN